MNFKELISKIKKVFSLKNLTKIMLSVLLGWIIRNIIISYFNLDVSNLLDTFIVYTPAVIAASVLKIFLDFDFFKIEITQDMTNKTHQTFDPKKVTAFNSDLKSKLKQEMQSMNDKRDKMVRKMETESVKKTLLERVREIEAKKNLTINRNAESNHRQRLSYAASPGPGTLVVVDTNGIGARGYSHTITNQPFARDLANVLSNYKLNNRYGSYEWPPLDPVAKKFLADALPVVHPSAFGPNPTLEGPGYPCTSEVINNLHRLS